MRSTSSAGCVMPVHDRAEQNAGGVVGELRSRVAAGARRVAREHLHAAEFLIGERVPVALEMAVHGRIVADERHGRMLIAMTRFYPLGDLSPAIPLGLMLDEMARLMKDV